MISINQKTGVFEMNESEIMRRRHLQAYKVIAGGFLVHLTLGTIYSIGNMVPYVISYIREHSEPKTITYSAGTWIFAASLGSQGLCMFLGGVINTKLGPRWTTLIGSLVTSVGILLTYFSLKVSYYLTITTYGLMFGIGVGITYATPVACAMKWLPKRKGLVTGVVVAGFGGGSFVFSQIQTAFINPKNLSPDKEVGNEKYFSKENAPELLERVPQTFLLMSGLFVVLQLIGSMLLRNPTEQECDHLEESNPLIDKEQEQANSDKKGSTDLENSAEDIPNLHPYEVLKTRAFYTLWSIFLMNGQTILFITALYKAYGQTFISNDRFLSYVGAFASVFNASGRPMWGFLADRFGFKKTMMALCSILITLVMTLIATPYGGESMFFIWICGIFLTFSGNFALLPAATAAAFGQRYVAINYGLVFSAGTFAGLLGAVITTSVESHVGWFGMFCIVSSFSFLGLLLALSYNVKHNGRNV